ncbi:MAG: hypothetical protein WDW38_007173 [Sanguina aurantia]
MCACLLASLYAQACNIDGMRTELTQRQAESVGLALEVKAWQQKEARESYLLAARWNVSAAKTDTFNHKYKLTTQLVQTLREGVRMMERDEASVDKFYATSTTYSSFVSSSLIASLGSGSLVGRPATVGRAVVRNAAPVGARALPPAVGGNGMPRYGAPGPAIAPAIFSDSSAAAQAPATPLTQLGFGGFPGFPGTAATIAPPPASSLPPKGRTSSASSRIPSYTAAGGAATPAASRSSTSTRSSPSAMQLDSPSTSGTTSSAVPGRPSPPPFNLVLSGIPFPPGGAPSSGGGSGRAGASGSGSAGASGSGSTPSGR